MGLTSHAPCMTPRGEFFELSKGRYVTDVEKMLFQSFPVHQLDLKPLSRRELEDLAGNSMNIRACAAAWLCLFSTLDLQKWNQAGITADTTDPLLHDTY
ncbi:unnamed protein product [Cladocopium goreaui]|uniref:DNA (Cytosine-5-)-methyltransferase n=1 Tax=Cladocopium goreaui TaxID=2562237 RepID=A0A9P1FUI5_9DINO|nr:unnamed protein product [Cladocopium goreaui]